MLNSMVLARVRPARPVLAQLPPAAGVDVGTVSGGHRWLEGQAQQARQIGQSKEAPKATKKA